MTHYSTIYPLSDHRGMPNEGCIGPGSYGAVERLGRELFSPRCVVAVKKSGGYGIAVRISLVTPGVDPEDQVRSYWGGDYGFEDAQSAGEAMAGWLVSQAGSAGLAIEGRLVSAGSGVAGLMIELFVPEDLCGQGAVVGGLIETLEPADFSH